MSFGALADISGIPAHGVVLDVAPQVDHIRVVWILSKVLQYNKAGTKIG